MNEQISALIDDEIALEDAAHLMAALQANSGAAQAWSHYHLIGDAMRGTEALSPNFKHNLMQKIELEPTVLSPNAAQFNQNDVEKAINRLQYTLQVLNISYQPLGQLQRHLRR